MIEGWIINIDDKERLLIFSESEHYHGTMILNYIHENLYVGQKVRVQTDGIMALSLPPIMTPNRIEVIDEQRYFVIQGILKQKGRPLLISTEKGDTIINVDPSYELNDIELGASLIIFYDGKMARSMPPQVWAKKVMIDYGSISRNDNEAKPCCELKRKKKYY